MPISKVTFGSVIAVSGKNSKVNKINNRLTEQVQNGNIIMRDVTYHYKNASTTGVLGKAAQKGDKVEIYITGKDVHRVKKQAPGWDTLDGILSNLSAYFSADKMSTNDIVEKVISS